MLTTTKNITITGTCKINETAIEKYTAVINQSDPSNMSISTVQLKKDLIKENIEACRADRAEFEDIAYAAQDELSSTKEETE